MPQTFTYMSWIVDCEGAGSSKTCCRPVRPQPHSSAADRTATPARPLCIEYNGEINGGHPLQRYAQPPRQPATAADCTAVPSMHGHLGCHGSCSAQPGPCVADRDRKTYGVFESMVSKSQSYSKGLAEHTFSNIIYRVSYTLHSLAMWEKLGKQLLRLPAELARLVAVC